MTPLDTVLLTGIGALASALAWMTIGRFGDRKEFENRLAALVAEHSKEESEQQQRTSTILQEQTRASVMVGQSQRELGAALERVADGQQEVVRSLDHVLDRFVREALAPEPIPPRPGQDVAKAFQLPRRTISEKTMLAVRKLKKEE